MTQRHLTARRSHVSPAERQKLLRQRGVVIWLTGLSGSGKSTLAYNLERRLIDDGHLAFVLDGDNIRHGLNNDLGFSPEHRKENIRRIGEVSALFADSGVLTITSFISPYREDREFARKTIGTERFIEVHLDVSVEVCEQRDPKGLYQKARAGEIPEFTGVTAPYEAPVSPEVRVETHRHTPEECVDQVIAFLRSQGLIVS